MKGRSGNMPPFSIRDFLGIGMPVVGTGILIVLPHRAVNLAHIVGLMFFQTVRYRGFWRDFFARTVLYATLAAIVAAGPLHPALSEPCSSAA